MQDSLLRELGSLPLYTHPVRARIECSPLLVLPDPWEAELAQCMDSPAHGSTDNNRTAGLLTTYASWRWAFYLQAMMTAVFVIMVYCFVPNDSKTITRREPIDWFGALLISAGLCGICFALTDAETSPNGWGTDYIIVALVLGVASCALFIWLQCRLEYPLMPASIWRYPQFPRVIATYFLGFTTFSGVLVFSYTLLWQLVFGRNAIGVYPHG